MQATMQTTGTDYDTLQYKLQTRTTERYWRSKLQILTIYMPTSWSPSVSQSPHHVYTHQSEPQCPSEFRPMYILTHRLETQCP